MLERSRDLLAGDLTLDYLIRKASEGWKIAAVEWIREAAPDRTTAAITTSPSPEEVPYGFQISEGGDRLEPMPMEMSAVFLILDQIVKEKRLSNIADELNLAGFRTRTGQNWNPAAVFDMLPRIVELGPRLFKSPEWRERNRSVTH